MSKKKKGEKKNEPQFLVVHTMLRGSSESHSWYLDSVCSYLMNMNKFLFTSFIECNILKR